MFLYFVTPKVLGVFILSAVIGFWVLFPKKKKQKKHTHSLNKKIISSYEAQILFVYTEKKNKEKSAVKRLSREIVEESLKIVFKN